MLIRLRRDTAAAWLTEDPVLDEGEPGYETDTARLKIGDGATVWSQLWSGNRFLASSGPASGLLAALYRGQSTAVHLVGDSTGDATTEWFGLLGGLLGTAHPTYNVLHRAWNDGDQWYDLPTALQSGAAGDRYVTTAAARLCHTATAITGDLDIRAKVRPNSWNSGATQCIAARYTSAGNQKGFYCGLSTTGKMLLVWTEDGATTKTKVSTVNPAYADGDTAWLRWTLDVDNGAIGNDVKFYTSDDGVAWVQVGATVTTAAVTSIFASTSAYQLGTLDGAGGSPFNGRIHWVEIRDGLGGISLVPPLPDTWDQISSATGNTVLLGGAPTLLLVNGSVAGQNISYFDDAARLPKLLSAHAPSLIILNTGHNDTLKTTQQWITAYSAWVANIKTQYPGVPILCLTQNPATAPIATNSIATRAQRGSELARWAASQAGVYVIDTYPAFTATATQIGADGIHPTATGSTAWARYLYAALVS